MLIQDLRKVLHYGYQDLSYKSKKNINIIRLCREPCLISIFNFSIQLLLNYNLYIFQRKSRFYDTVNPCFQDTGATLSRRYLRNRRRRTTSGDSR